MQFGRGKPAVGAFYDSDFTTIDSVLAMSILFGLQGKNDCRVAMIACSRPDLATVGFVDAVERYYHGPGRNFAQLVPIGMITSGKPGDTPKAFFAPFESKKYTNQVKTVIDTADPNTLYRNYLLAQGDKNCFFVLAGPATNLAAALAFRGMKELITAKVKYLVIATVPAFDTDREAARTLLGQWPTPVILAGRELGEALPFPGASIDKEFAANSPDNPVAAAYRAWREMPYDTPSCAMAAALYAGRPKEGYFKLSEPEGSGSEKRQRLLLDPEQKAKVIQTYVELASAKPVIRLRFRPDAADQDKLADPADKAEKQQ